jgi:arsenate reductase (glutaredoxin)
MKKAYCVSTCTTCQRIMKDSNLIKKGYAYQNIKEEKITAEQLDEMKAMIGSYEALFSRRALKYKAMGLKDKKLTEKDYRDLILQEYTFLKRPVVISGKKIFSGSEKKTVAEVIKLK